MKGKFDKEARAESARAYFKQGYNCCQSVALAYSDLFGMDKDSVAALASGFGGGFGRLREVCGCVSGMTMVAGAVMPATDPGDSARKTENYALVQRLAGKYAEENGSIICRELLGLARKGSSPESPAPSERTGEYYRKRPCPELCACAARIIAEELDHLKQ